MKLFIVLILVFIFKVTLSLNPRLSISAQQTNPIFNQLNQVYHDISKSILEFESYEQVDAAALLKYGIVRIESTNSIIVSNVLALEAMNPSYIPTLNNAKNYGEKLYDYVEISFTNSSCKSVQTDWEPIGQCNSNELSSTDATFTQEWTLEVSSGLTNTVTFAAIMGFTPVSAMSTSLSRGISGSTACDVLPGKAVQLQIKTELITISGVKTRSIGLSRTFAWPWNNDLKLQVGAWENEQDYTVINSRKFETACVTQETC